MLHCSPTAPFPCESRRRRAPNGKRQQQLPLGSLHSAVVCQCFHSPPKATPKKAPTAKPKALRIDPTPPPPAPSASSPPPSPRKKKAKKSKGYETFAPREKFAGDDTWMRHTYSKMGEVLSTGTYEQERPKLKGYEKDLLEQFTAASEENERVSKIMKARVDMSERVALTVDRQSGSMQG